MNKVDKKKQNKNVFIDNTSFVLSSVFNLSPKIFYKSKDSVELKSNLNNYFRFIIEVRNNDKSYRMIFVISKNEKHLQLIQSSIISTIYDGSSFFENGKPPLLIDFWYNFAAIYMFSFLDSINCIGDSSIYDYFEISQNECCTYFSSQPIPIVMGIDISSASANNGVIAYIGMLS